MDEPVKKEDFPLLDECNMRCPLCMKKLVENKKEYVLKKYGTVPIFPAWLDIVRHAEFSVVAPKPKNPDSRHVFI